MVTLTGRGDNPKYMIRAIPSKKQHRITGYGLLAPSDQDGNCGVLYERMARALVLCSGAVPNGTPEQQASSRQRRQTAPGTTTRFFVCFLMFGYLFFWLNKCEGSFFFGGEKMWHFCRCSFELGSTHSKAESGIIDLLRSTTNKRL